MVEERVNRRLAAVMAADAVAYSRMIRADEAGTRSRFNGQLDNVVRPAIDENRGRLVKTMGDGFPRTAATCVAFRRLGGFREDRPQPQQGWTAGVTSRGL